MALNTHRENIVEICSILAQQENLNATLIQSGKGALIAGFGVFIGGILGGPPGMAVGGTLSSVAVALSSRGKFKSVVEIINEMSNDQKTRLSNAINRAIQNVRPEDYATLLTLALTTPSVKQVILRELGAFLMKELNYHVR